MRCSTSQDPFADALYDHTCALRPRVAASLNISETADSVLSISADTPSDPTQHELLTGPVRAYGCDVGGAYIRFRKRSSAPAFQWGIARRSRVYPPQGCSLEAVHEKRTKTPDNFLSR
jgi:hypothetical protein